MDETKQSRIESSQQDYLIIGKTSQSSSKSLLQNNYQSKYQNLLNASPNTKVPKTEMVSRFRMHKLQYCVEPFQQQIQISVLGHTSNYEALKLAVSYGRFRTTLNLINIDMQNPLNNAAQCTLGGFGFVYRYFHQHFPSAIKCVKINNQRFEIGVRQTVKEYLFTMIASALKAGPSLTKLFGFDIVVFRDSFAFTMEYCQMGRNQISGFLPGLKEKLSLLHTFHIVHLDIKPENIGFSPSLKQCIFIDFGLSRMIKQEISELTYTNFVGSFNFCSPEMLELYLEQKNGSVNLYYNDAFCLDKSVKTIQNSQVIENSQQIFFRDKFMDDKLQKIKVKLEIKMILFEYSLGQNTCESIYYSFNKDRQRILKENRYEFKQFITELPQSLQLVVFYKNLLKHTLGLQDIFYYDQIIKRQHCDEGKDTSLFGGRFQRIKYINYSDEQLQQIQTSINIFDLKSVKQSHFFAYKLILIKFIKINNEIQDFPQKLKACKIFRQLYLKDQQINGEILYKQTVERIFESSIMSHQPRAYQILFHSIQTVILLEIVPQQRLIDAFNSILSNSFEFVCKMRLAFQFIQSLQFVKEKYITRYEYDQLANILMNNLNCFLDKIVDQITNTQEISVIKKLKFVILYKIPLLGVQRYLLNQIDDAQSRKQPIELKLLNQSILLYLLYMSTNYCIQKYNYYSQINFRLILIKLNMLGVFSYSHFLLFTITYQTNQMAFSQNVYNYFLSKFGHFQQHKHFKIYFVNQFSAIKRAHSKAFFIHRKEVAQKQIQGEDEEGYNEIFKILDFIIKDKDHFHDYLKYLFSVKSISLSPIYMNYLKQLICNNRQKITRLSNNYDQLKRYFHQNKLKSQIFVINKIIQAMPQILNNQQYSHQLSSFIGNCEQTIDKYKCFECKVNSLLQMQNVYANYFFTCQKDQQKSFLLLIDTFAFCLKHNQCGRYGFSILTDNLVRLWAKSSYLYGKYDINPFLYDIIVSKQVYHYCLIDSKQYNIFFHLYLHIASIYDKSALFNFVFNIIHSLFHKKSNTLVTNFYYSWQYIVHIKKTEIQKINFINQHQQIIIQLMKFKGQKCSYLFTLYYSPFLQMRIRSKLQIAIVREISLSIDYLDNHAKSLILNNYYQQFAFYFKVCKRKQKYLCFQHFKKCAGKYLLSFIIKKKLKKSSSEIKRKKISFLKEFIEKYHKNIENI